MKYISEVFNLRILRTNNYLYFIKFNNSKP